MTINFKNFVSFVSMPDEASDEQINELFGIFSNNRSINKLRANREKLKQDTAKKVLTWREKKEAEAAAKAEKEQPKNMQGRPSAAASGRAAEKDWMMNMEAAVSEDVEDSFYVSFWQQFAPHLSRIIGKDVKFLAAKDVSGKRGGVGRFADFEIDGENVRIDHSWKYDGSSMKPVTTVLFGIDDDDVGTDTPVHDKDYNFGRLMFITNDPQDYADLLSDAFQDDDE